MSNAVTFQTCGDTSNFRFVELDTPVDTSGASSLASDGTSLYYLRRDSLEFYRSDDDGETWTPLSAPDDDLDGWHGDWSSGTLAYDPLQGALWSTYRNTNDDRRAIRYDIAGDQWQEIDSLVLLSHGVAIVGDYMYGIAHAIGSNFGGPIERVHLRFPHAELPDRTTPAQINGDNGGWLSRVAQLAALDGRIWGIKNDWVTPDGTGDRVFSFAPDAFDPSIFTGIFPDELWDSSKWQAHTTPMVDGGQIPFEIGYGSALVPLPPDWSCHIGVQGGLFILAGCSPANHEGWGDASDLFALYDVATGSFQIGTLPDVSGYGASATFMDGAIYVKRGGTPGYNTRLWRISPNVTIKPGDCDGDDDVDLDDFAILSGCVSGPQGGLRPGCACCDADGDEDVDLADGAAFQREFTGQLP
jgi:hypothetical protein